MATKKTTDWVVVNSQGQYICKRCKDVYTPDPTPQPVEVFVGIMEVFRKHHAKCKEGQHNDHIQG